MYFTILKKIPSLRFKSFRKIDGLQSFDGALYVISK